MEGKHFQKGRGRISNNLLLHKSNENTGNTVRINIFRILEINQRLTTIKRVFIQEKWLGFSNCSELCGISTCLILSSLTITTAVKTSSLTIMGWGRTSLESQTKVLFQENCSYLTCLAAPWKNPITGLAFI